MLAPQRQGELAKRVESELVDPPAPDPQEAADAIAALIRMTPGHRPLRTLVGEQVQQLPPDLGSRHGPG